jgi:hypothetical protein
MQPAPKAPRTPATGHDTYRTGARRSSKSSAQCENGPSHQTQYPRFHELVHTLGVTYDTHSRPEAEVIVDVTTMVILAGVALDVSGETIPYIAGWGETGAIEAVTEQATLIDTLARRLENILHAESDEPVVGEEAETTRETAAAAA